MCGRFALYETVPEVAERFHVDELRVEEAEPRWNIAPSQPVLAIATTRDGSSRRLGELRWGLVPWWAPDPTIGSRLINARAEVLSTSRAFRAAFERRRCIIPASGFYEWRQRPVPGRRRPASQPFYVHRDDGAPLAIGGLWEVWHDAEGRTLRTCTIITTAPNQTVSRVHDRMPLILAPGAWDTWLAPRALHDNERARMLVPAPEQWLALYPVGDGVNSPREEGPHLIEPSAAASA